MNHTSSTIAVLSVAIVALGYVFIDRPIQDQLTRTEHEHDRVIAETDRNIALARDGSALGHQLATLRATMSAVDLSSDSARLVATFVGEATAVAHACHVRITGLDGRPLTRSVTTRARTMTSEPSALATSTIELTVEGSYANIIRSLRRLSRERVPVRVEVASIERAAGPPHEAEPLLDARVRVDVLHRSSTQVSDAATS